MAMVVVILGGLIGFAVAALAYAVGVPPLIALGIWSGAGLFSAGGFALIALTLRHHPVADLHAKNA